MDDTIIDKIDSLIWELMESSPCWIKPSVIYVGVTEYREIRRLKYNHRYMNVVTLSREGQSVFGIPVIFRRSMETYLEVRGTYD